MRLNLIMWEKENGYKALWVADRIGVTPQTYCKIKAGKQDPSFQTIKNFTRAFPDENVLELFENN